MKTTMSLKILIPVTTMSFLLAYVFKLSVLYWEQFFALTTIILVDGIFGIIAGIKREGFKTYKALKIFKTLFVWIIILASILITEKAFPFASWLSETFILPVIVFYLISSIKNATSSGFIKSELMKQIMEKIDRHKNTEQ
jgi:hypothetical protein